MRFDQARRDAILRLGGVERAREALRDRSTVPLVENLLRDGRFAIRQRRRNPGFSATAVVVLALGTAASVAIADVALIRPLPYPNPDRLVGVTESVPLIPRANLPYFDYLDWKRLNQVFISLEVYTSSGYMLSAPEGVELVSGERVSDGFFRTALALLVGVVGLYGVVAYSVSRRTREIGVRMALGARPSEVTRQVLTEAGRLAVAGIVLGASAR
jgi:FtsX-like permease family